ncbi:MAG: hypothetical protein ABR881_01860 [Candidatus Sulfotelmatobacter sp.]|jgi:hypothetical protein
MVLVILLVWAVLFVPLGCFLAAAVVEIRSPQRGSYFFVRMAEIAAGVIALCAITRVGQDDAVSWRMVGFSLLLGGVSLISDYSSRGARFCALFASATLAYLWYFKGAYHAEHFAFAAFLLFLLFASGIYGVFRYVIR